MSLVDTWTAPEIDAGFRTAIGSSVLEEFVVGHDFSDVVRELVQNEFDAGGKSLRILLSTKGLTVLGSGRHIDANGWSRLDAILGTGHVVGQGSRVREIPRKRGGIGSKNFGLRTLFLIGNRFYVRSNGKVAVLDLPRMGTMRLPDSKSRGRTGIRIHAPFRDKQFQSLSEFTLEHERKALETLRLEQLATMLKLALAGKRRGIQQIHIRSERLGEFISWNQASNRAACSLQGVSCVRRIGRLRHTCLANKVSKRKRFEELEYCRIVPIPSTFDDISFPSYFHHGSRVRICVSLPMRGNRIDLEQNGLFFYPLAAEHALTGTVASVNAPFQLDADRSNLINSSWNTWLAKEAAQLTLDLLVGDWFARFGADAYCAVNPERGSPSHFCDEVRDRLAGDTCWPTLAKRGRSVRYAMANEIVVPVHEELNGFLSDRRYLSHSVVTNTIAAEMAVRFGAKRYTLNSLVRLRCAHKDVSTLRTKIQDDANYHYTDYKRSIGDEKRQVKFASALQRHSRRLSNNHRFDIKTTASTLAADGSLKAANKLIIVERGIWTGCPVAMSDRLHASLHKYRVIASACTPFDINAWIQRVAARAARQETSNSELEALYRHLLNPHVQLDRNTIASVIRSPVVKDHRGDWVSPSELVKLKKDQFSVVEPVVKAPSRELIDADFLMNRLRIRSKLRGDDLIAMAKYIVAHPSCAERFENLLRQELRLLTATTVTGLREVAFLRTMANTLAAPKNLLLPTIKNLACIDDPESFAARSKNDGMSLYRKLKCRPHPTADELLGSLEVWRDEHRKPRQPSVYYTALVDALQTELGDAEFHEDEPILWVDGDYYAPSDTLVGRRVSEYFNFALPHFDGPERVCAAYIALGASETPNENHWEQLILWFARQSSSGSTPLGKHLRIVLSKVYRDRANRGLPRGINNDVRCLLSDVGTLHSLNEVERGSYLENDYQELADSLVEVDQHVWFAKVGSESVDFFREIGLKKLSEECSEYTYVVGAESEAPSWFASRCNATLRKFRKPSFVAALLDLAGNYYRDTGGIERINRESLNGRLNNIRRISCVEEIKRVHRVASANVRVLSESAVAKNGIAMLAPRNRYDFDHMLALAISEIVGTVRVCDMRNFAICVLPLLSCRTVIEMATCLRRQGIQLGAWSQDVQEDNDLAFKHSFDDGAEDIIQGIVEELMPHNTQSTELSQEDSNRREIKSEPEKSSTSRATSLPSIEEVTLTESHIAMEQVDTRKIAGQRTSGGRRWRGRNQQEMDRDGQLGDRGEELIYLRELERIKRHGHASPEEIVVWSSRTNPNGDHDIRSIDENGDTLWIEVKSTSGSDGNFAWSRREFEKAMNCGESYELWRVYQVDTKNPIAKVFRNPIALLRAGAIRLQLGSLRATVEPIDATTVSNSGSLAHDNNA